MGNSPPAMLEIHNLISLGSKSFFFFVSIGAISKGIWLPSLVANSLLILDLLVQLYFVFIFLTFLILIRGHFL